MKQVIVSLMLLSTSVFAGIPEDYLQKNKGVYALAKGRVEARCSNLIFATFTLNHDYSLKEVEIHDMKGVNAGRISYKGEPTRAALYVERHPVSGFTDEFIIFVVNSRNNLEAAVYANKATGVSLDLCDM